MTTEEIKTLMRFFYGINKAIKITHQGKDLKIGDYILAPKDDDSGDEFTIVSNIYDTGEKEVYEITLSSGRKIRSTLEHKHWCSDGKCHMLKDILRNGYEILCEDDE